MTDLPALLAWTLIILDWSIRIGLCIRVIARRITVQASLAWLALIFFVPFVGAVIYLLVGENRLGAKRARRYNELTAGMNERAVFLWRQGVDWTLEAVHPRHVAQLGTAFTHLPPLRGNELELYHDSRETIAAIEADIDNAEQYCHLQTFIWQVGGEPDRIVQALIRAAERGVTCRVLVDAIGSKRFLRSKHASSLRAAGVHVVAALPVNPVRMLFYRLDLRNHRKIVTIDGKVAYVGSQNMTDDSFRVARRPGLGPWIDANVRVVGPAAQALGLVFLRDWLLDTNERLTLNDFMPEIPVSEGAVAQLLPSGPGPTPAAIHKMIIESIYAARKELILTTPYYAPDETMETALESAAMRGVDVSLIIPRKLDSRIVQLASRSHFQDLLKAGAKVWLHEPGLLHAKTITVDRKLCMIGSVNLDMRSFWLNFEATLFIYDSDFTSQVRMMQRHHMHQSTQIHIDEWAQRPTPHKLLENAARLFSPVL